MYQVHIDSMDAPGYTSVGLCNVSGDFNNAPGNDGNSAGYNSLGQVVFGFSVVATYASFSAGDTISLAINSGFLFVRVNSGNWNNNASVDPTNASSGLGGIVNSLGTPPAQLYPMIGVYDTGRTVTVNLGGTAYSPAAPVGALNFGA
jgi:hypothetical protein